MSGKNRKRKAKSGEPKGQKYPVRAPGVCISMFGTTVRMINVQKSTRSRIEGSSRSASGMHVYDEMVQVACPENKQDRCARCIVDSLGAQVVKTEWHRIATGTGTDLQSGASES